MRCVASVLCLALAIPRAQSFQLSTVEAVVKTSDAAPTKTSVKHTPSHSLAGGRQTLVVESSGFTGVRPASSTDSYDVPAAARPMLGQVAQDPVETTTPDPTGLTLNGVGDLDAFMAALISNVLAIVVFMCIFMWLRKSYPIIYSHNVANKDAPLESYKEEWTNSAFGWFRAAFSYKLGDRWLEKEGNPNLDGSLNLDQTMLLEFTKVGMKVMAIIGVPMILIMGPLHWMFGGNAAGEDHMSYLSFGNVMSCGMKKKQPVRLNPDFDNCWIYNIHAFVVWAVVFTVQVALYAAQDRFVKIRQKWLARLPEAQATTLLVEDIPERYRSDAKLLELFKKVLGNQVTTCHVVKYMPELTNKIAAVEAAKLNLKKEEAKEKAGRVAATAREAMSTISGPDSNSWSTSLAQSGQLAAPLATKSIKQDIEALEKEVTTLRAQAIQDAKADKPGVNCAAGFVTFKHRASAEAARNLQFFADQEEFIMSTPPEPASLYWSDLQQDPLAGGARTVIGYGLVTGLYFAYLPCVIYITNIAKKINMGPFQSVWAGLAPTMGLQFMVAMLPTFLIIIFRAFFTLKADVYAQKALQNWYFVFQVVFVIMATAVGTNINKFMLMLASEPFEAFGELADSMPMATHFYMNFLVLQWVTHFMNLMRYVQLSKYLMFRKVFGSDEDGKAMAEPEDQDYYGMGSRSARFTINLCIGVVFGTLSPPINFLCFVNFFICRIVYGYLIPFAETKKADLGGAFFVDCLRHLFTGNIIYCFLMVGVLYRRADTWLPVIIAAPSIFYVIWSMKRFDRKYSWEHLPYTVLAEDDKAKDAKAAKRGGSYVQPELQDS
jgi:hypothetical protein